MKTKIFSIFFTLSTSLLPFAQVCTDIDAVGSASNLFTIGLTENNSIAVDNDLNTVLFIHRNNAGIFGGHSGNLRYDISTDNGVTWTSDVGPLNPASVNGTNAARYPNVAIYNPTGNTNPDNAYLSYIAPTVAGATWANHVSGVRRLNGTGNTETYNQTGTTQNYIPRSMCKGANGTMWAIDAIYNGTVFTGYRILKGVWNGTNDFVWSVNATLNPPFNTLYDGTAHSSNFTIGFDPTGQIGYVCLISDISPGASSYTFNPIFYRTTNGGTTWSAPEQVDLAQFSCVSSFITAGNVPTVAFEVDLTVDVNGNPHALVCVGSNPSSYSIFFTDPHHMFDVTQENGVWNAIDLGVVNAGRQTFGVSPNQLIMDMNPQASRTDDGTKVFFTWAGSDAVPVQDAPNLYGIGYDVLTKELTPMKDFSTCNAATSGQMLFPRMAENVLNVSGGWELPIIYGSLTVPNDVISPANFIYLDSLLFTPADFNLGICTAAITFSNPDTVTLCEGATGVLAVTSTHDLLLWDTGATTSSISTSTGGWNYVTARNNCCLGTDSIFVIIDSLAIASYSTSINSLSVDFLNASTGSPTDYLWDFGDGTTSTSVDPSHVYDFPGDYTVCLIASDACGADTICTLVTVSCTVPSPGFSQVIGSAGLVTFTSTTTPTADTYLWDFGDGVLSNLENPTHIYTATGTYQVCLTIQDTCGSDVFCTTIDVDPFASLQDLAGMDIDVYPNPADDVLYIKGTGLENQEWNLTLVNALGAVCWSSTVTGTALNEMIPLDALASSMYYLEIRSNKYVGRYLVVRE